MKLNFLAAVTALVLILSAIAAIFWQQELQYVRPTPVPANYVPVAVGEKVSVAHPGIPKGPKPMLLHFFNPECPCSRFNLRHFKGLVKTYRNEITFLAVVPETFAGQAGQIRREFDLDIPVIADEEKALSRACGVYATPQAALVDGGGKLYYRGNYNKSRYCTTKNSNYAQMAIDSLLAGQPTATFGEPATSAYGCELPEPEGYEVGFAGLKD